MKPIAYIVSIACREDLADGDETICQTCTTSDQLD